MGTLKQMDPDVRKTPEQIWREMKLLERDFDDDDEEDEGSDCDEYD